MPVRGDGLLQQKTEMPLCPRGNFHRKPLLPGTRIWPGTTQQTLGLSSQAVPLPGQRLFVTSTVPPARKEHPVSAAGDRTGSAEGTRTPHPLSEFLHLRGHRGPPQHPQHPQPSRDQGHNHLMPTPVPGLAGDIRSTRTGGCTWLPPPAHAGASRHPCTSPCIPVLSLHPCSPLQSSGCHSNHSVPAVPATNALPQVQRLHLAPCQGEQSPRCWCHHSQTLHSEPGWHTCREAGRLCPPGMAGRWCFWRSRWAGGSRSDLCHMWQWKPPLLGSALLCINLSVMQCLTVVF